MSAGSINVSVSGSIDLGLVTNDETGTAGESSAATVSVNSTDAGGYTLVLSGANSEGKLVGENPDNYFSSISETTGLRESTFAADSSYNNKWALLPSVYNGIENDKNDPYLYRVPMGDNLAILDQTTSASLSPNTYTLAVAARANSNTAIDNYSNSFVVAATGNNTDYTITYTDPLDFPDTQVGTTDGSSITISGVTPKKNGYKFSGWCSEVPSGTTCSGTTYQPGESYSLSSGARANLYAIWTPITCNGVMLQADNGRYYCFTNSTSTWANRNAGQCGDTTVWHIPAREDLYTLSHYNNNPKLYNALGLSSNRYYWSGTEYVSSNAYALNVNSSNSSVYNYDKTSNYYIMCVQ